MNATKQTRTCEGCDRPETKERRLYRTEHVSPRMLCALCHADHGDAADWYLYRDDLYW